MKQILIASITALTMAFFSSVILAHGGGCGKSLGLCCHVDSRTGLTHCH